MNKALIVGANALIKGNASFATAYGKTHKMAQDLAVSHLVHAAQHGNPDTLNTFFEILKTNDAQAFRLYVRRIFAVLGGWDGVAKITKDEMDASIELGHFMIFSKGRFKVIKNEDLSTAAKAKKGMVTLADALLSPDGKVWKAFMDRNNLAEIKSFGDDELKKAIAQLIKKASGDSESVESTVTEGAIAALKAAQAVIGTPKAVTIQ